MMSFLHRRLKIILLIVLCGVLSACSFCLSELMTAPLAGTSTTSELETPDKTLAFMYAIMTDVSDATPNYRPDIITPTASELSAYEAVAATATELANLITAGAGMPTRLPH